MRNRMEKGICSTIFALGMALGTVCAIGAADSSGNVIRYQTEILPYEIVLDGTEWTESTEDELASMGDGFEFCAQISSGSYRQINVIKQSNDYISYLAESTSMEELLQEAAVEVVTELEEMGFENVSYEVTDVQFNGNTETVMKFQSEYYGQQISQIQIVGIGSDASEHITISAYSEEDAEETLQLIYSAGTSGTSGNGIHYDAEILPYAIEVDGEEWTAYTDTELAALGEGFQFCAENSGSNFSQINVIKQSDEIFSAISESMDIYEFLQLMEDEIVSGLEEKGYETVSYEISEIQIDGNDQYVLKLQLEYYGQQVYHIQILGLEGDTEELITIYSTSEDGLEQILQSFYYVG